MPIVDIKGVKINVEGEIEANRPAIIAVHGAGGGAWLWRKLRDALADKASLLAVDLPGHGDSEGEGASSVAEYSETVREISKNLSLEKPFVMGHSMGGAVAMDWAVKHPEEPGGLLLVATGARLRVLEAILDSILRDYDGYIEGQLRMAFASPPAEDVAEMLRQGSKKVDPRVAHTDFKACDAFDLMEDIPKINAKTLVLCGDKDIMTPPKYGQFLAKNIPGAKLATIENSGHMIPLEKPVEAAAAIASML